jgi:hypothetical protein
MPDRPSWLNWSSIGWVSTAFSSVVVARSVDIGVEDRHAVGGRPLRRLAIELVVEDGAHRAVGPRVLKMSGLPNRARASLSASTQNPAVSVFDSRQDSTRRVAQSRIATRYKTLAASVCRLCQRPTPPLSRGQALVRLIDRPAAQKVRVDLALGCRLLAFRFGLTAHSPSSRISRRTRRRPTEIPSRNSATCGRRLP